jgi:L-ascorbate metabolism protein UlaG (beta-lactamase superfamily)
LPRATDSPVGPPAAIEVLFVGHSSVLLTLDGVRVLTDPFLRARLGPLQRHGAPPDIDALRPDVVVISHGHRDHFDPASLAALPGSPSIVVPRGLAASLRRDRSLRGPVIELAAGETVEIDGVHIRATPARHWISPGAARAEPVGYVLEGDPAVYFAGDTGRFPGMKEAAGRIDLALLPVWTWGPHLGPGHLGPRSAAEVVHDLRPAAVIPIHWGTLYPRGLHRVWRRALEDPADRFAAHVATLSPEVDVRVLRPGEATSLDPRAGP